MISRTEFDAITAAGMESVVSRWSLAPGGGLVLDSYRVLPKRRASGPMEDVTIRGSGVDLSIRVPKRVRDALADYLRPLGYGRSVALLRAREAHPGMADPDALAAFLGVAQ